MWKKSTGSTMVAQPNEVVRQLENNRLYTQLLPGNVAIVVYDELGNASLCHVHIKTKLDYLHRELSWLKGEELYIRIFYTHRNKLMKKVCQWLDSTKIDADIVEVKTLEGDVIVQNKALNNISRSLYGGFMDGGDHVKVSKLRYYHQYLGAYFDNGERMPDVVYDGMEWAQSFYQLPEEIKGQVREYLDIKDSFLLRKALTQYSFEKGDSTFFKQIDDIIDLLQIIKEHQKKADFDLLDHGAFVWDGPVNRV